MDESRLTLRDVWDDLKIVFQVCVPDISVSSNVSRFRKSFVFTIIGQALNDLVIVSQVWYKTLLIQEVRNL